MKEIKLRSHYVECISDFQELSTLLNRCYRQPDVFQKTLNCGSHRYLKTHWLQFLCMSNHCSIQRKENWKHSCQPCVQGVQNTPPVRRVQQLLHTTQEHEYPAWNSNMCIDATMPKNDRIVEVESTHQRSSRIIHCSVQCSGRFWVSPTRDSTNSEQPVPFKHQKTFCCKGTLESLISQFVSITSCSFTGHHAENLPLLCILLSGTYTHW